MEKKMKIARLIGFLAMAVCMFFSISCFKIYQESEDTGTILETEEGETQIETATETTTETTAETIEKVTETETETVIETSTETEVTPSTPDTNLTRQEAIDIAMGVAQGDIDRIETEIEDGRLVWKIRIISNGIRTDIRIDDSTGEVVRVETKED